MTTETYTQKTRAALRAVDGNPYKLPAETRRDVDIVARAEYMMSALQNILRDGGKMEDLETLEHDFGHLKSLMTRKFSN